MDRLSEQRLRDEVLYLHSLFRQGPPTSHPNPYPINPTLPLFHPNPPIPIYNQLPYPNNHNVPILNPHQFIPRNPQPFNPTNFRKQTILRPSVATTFKKENKGKKKRGKRDGASNADKKWPPISDIEWPCNPVPEETTHGWPTLNLKPTPVTRLPTVEEQARILSNHSQKKALEAAKEIFGKNMDSDGEVGDDDDSIMNDDGDDDIMDDDECEEYKFFLKTFMEDSELRCYYEKNYESGEFCCLVCGGIGQKVGKRYKNCVALIQHSITIAKTKKRRAHRALGEVICKVLGWDIKKLPPVNLPTSGDSQVATN